MSSADNMNIRHSVVLSNHGIVIMRRKKLMPPAVAVMDIADPLAFRDTTTNKRREIVYHEPKLAVVRSLRDDPLARLHHHHQITDAQYAAGRRWQALYEDSQVGKMRSSGDLKEPVDGSRAIAEPLTDRQRKAAKRIAEIDRALGQDGSALVRDVLAEGLDFAAVCHRRALLDTEGNRKYCGRRFRECLDTMGKMLGTG